MVAFGNDGMSDFDASSLKTVAQTASVKAIGRLCFDIDPMGSHILFSDFDNVLALFERVDLTVSSLGLALKQRPIQIRFVPGRDGLALVAGEAGMLDLYDIQERKLVRSFGGHSGNVSSIDLFASGRYAVSGSPDDTIRVWHIDSGQQVYQFSSQGWSGARIDVSSDQKYLVSGGGKLHSPGGRSAKFRQNNAVHLWRMPSEAELETRVKENGKGSSRRSQSPQDENGSGGGTASTSDRSDAASEKDLTNPPDTASISQQPFSIMTHGLPIPQVLKPEERTPARPKAGVFAHIRGAGKMRFPELDIKTFAAELDIQVNSADHLTGVVITFGRSASTKPIYGVRAVGKTPPPNRVVSTLCVISKDRTGYRRPPVESIFGEMVKLRLLVGEHRQLLYAEGAATTASELPLPAYKPQIEIDASGQNIDVIIHRFLLRALTDEEKSRLSQ